MLRKTVSKKSRAVRQRWSFRLGSTVIFRWEHKPTLQWAERWLRAQFQEAQPGSYAATLCYDGKPVHTWDAEVVYG
jgi:hypothetical protein